MSTTQSQTFKLSDVRSETERLLKINSSYSFNICFLFWFPIFIFHMFYPTLHSYLSKLNPIFNSILPVFYTIFLILIFLAFFCMISHSSFHAFYDRPSTLISDINSLSSSFLPLLSTFFVSACSLILPFGIIGFLICKLLETNDNNTTYESRYLSWVTAILVVLLVAVRVIYLQVDWFLALVISVVESRWGYEPLRRSAYLIEGMKMTAFCLIMLFGILGGFVYLALFYLPSSSGYLSWYYLLIASMVMRNGVAANVVVYIYCMKMHGELSMEETVDEEIASPHYLRLPTNDNDGVYI